MSDLHVCALGHLVILTKKEEVIIPSPGPVVFMTSCLRGNNLSSNTASTKTGATSSNTMLKDNYIKGREEFEFHLEEEGVMIEDEVVPLGMARRP